MQITLEGQLTKLISTSRLRIHLLIPLIILCYVAIAVKTIELTFFLDEQVKQETKRKIAILNPESFIRRNITDREGILLATTLNTSSVFANPREMIEKEDSAITLAEILNDVTAEELYEDFQKDKAFIWIKRNIHPQTKQKIYEAGLPAIYFKDEETRIYPHAELFAHILGFVGTDKNGLSGFERYYQLNKDEIHKYSSTLSSAVQKEKNTDELSQIIDNEVELNNLETTISNDNIASSNDDIALSLDLRVQNILYQALKKQMQKHKAIKASAIIMDVNNGEVLGFVNLPDFNPNNPSTLNSTNQFNLATLGLYELGSIFKPITFAIGLEEKKVNQSSRFDATKPLKVGKFTISDFHAKNKVMSLEEAITHSSNIATAKIAEKIGENLMRSYFEKLNLYEKLDFEVTEKARPIMPKIWRETTLLTASYGHGIAVTPLHALAAFVATINGGYYIQPTLLKRTGDFTKKKIFSNNTSLIMRKLLRNVVVEGSGKAADVEGYNVGGKTGTAEKLNNYGRYDKDKRTSTFVGVFPIDEPKYAVLILLDEPKGTKDTYGYATAGWVSAPAAKEVISNIAPILNIYPD